MSGPRAFSILVAASAMAAPLVTHAAAQDWPTRPLSMVVPFAAGSASDTVGRILAARLSELLGQQVVVENVGGAGGMTGAARVAKAAPDGYQFVLGGIDTFAESNALQKAALQRAERFRAGRADGRAAAGAARAQRSARRQSQ
jgi:tripartite-type tricarboxylate transporter receptor subunit TctC